MGGLKTLNGESNRVVGKKYSPDRLCKFLDTISTIPEIAEGCRCAGFDTSSYRYYMQQSKKGAAGFFIKWRDTEGWFHEFVPLAIEEGFGGIATEMLKRARFGYDEPLTDRGRVQYKLDPELLMLGYSGVEAYLLDNHGKPIPETVHHQDTELMRFIAERRIPAYMQRQQIEVNKTTHVMVVGATKPPAELDKIEQAALKAPVLDVEFDEVEPE